MATDKRPTMLRLPENLYEKVLLSRLCRAAFHQYGD